MIHVAIVEDERPAAEALRDCLEKFQKHSGEHIESTQYRDGESFLSHFHSQFDIVFMDIAMPGMDGMQTARKLRTIDQTVALIFVTNLSRYAINGYEVDAMDYLLKPLEYNELLLKMRKVINYCRQTGRKCIRLTTEGGSVRLSANNLIYIEASQHNIVYHTVQGDLFGHGTMKQVEQELAGWAFFRCSSSCLINLQYVQQIRGDAVTVAGKELPISHPRKREFLRALNERSRRMMAERGRIGNDI